VSVRLSGRPLVPAAAFRELDDPVVGGVVVFAGRVRADPTEAGTVTALLYEAHAGPALHVMEELEAEVMRRFGASRAVVWHRVGRVPVGAIAVIVGAACGHREPAFEATRYLIEQLKRTVPVWKETRARPARPPRRRPRPPRARSAG
jgi:molybdopterin synthase catalytic subunit